ncbi:hypothetical protein ABEG17_14585 [Pedococcus sp. KACC 23699]|uniref:Lipoprotein n=1 Tax=Pedococcus sp. KACC 23699 TaxID=3149228 RepID=A0AAU7JQX7_9MICO
MSPTFVDARPHPRTLPGPKVLAAAALSAALLTACGSGTGTGAPSPGAPADRARATRAAQLLDRFAAAKKTTDPPSLALAPDQLVRQVGDWETAVGDNDKQALLASHLTSAVALPDADRTGTVVDGTGHRTTTAIMSARDALASMTSHRTDCNACTDLQVTRARLTTMQVRTSSGTTTVPAWRFSFAGTAVTVLRVAVPDSGLVPSAPLTTTSPEPGDGPVVDSFSAGGDARTLRLHFSGAPDQPGPCGADYRAEQYASATAVVVAVVPIPRKAAAKDQACPAIAQVRIVDVVLDTPLVARTVINLVSGSVVPRTTGQVVGIPVR